MFHLLNTYSIKITILGLSTLFSRVGVVNDLFPIIYYSSYMLIKEAWLSSSFFEPYAMTGTQLLVCSAGLEAAISSTHFNCPGREKKSKTKAQIFRVESLNFHGF